MRLLTAAFAACLWPVLFSLGSKTTTGRQSESRYASGMTVICVLAAYLAIGFVSALAFVSIGAARVTHSSLTVGARILILPAATALWPYVLFRWLKAYRHP